MNNTQKLQTVINNLVKETKGEEFTKISSDFRIYTNPAARLIELEQMDKDGEMMKFIRSMQVTKSSIVLRFRCFLDAWLEHTDTTHYTRENMLQTFDKLLELAMLSVHLETPAKDLLEQLEQEANRLQNSIDATRGHLPYTSVTFEAYSIQLEQEETKLRAIKKRLRTLRALAADTERIGNLKQDEDTSSQESNASEPIERG